MLVVGVACARVRSIVSLYLAMVAVAGFVVASVIESGRGGCVHRYCVCCG